MSDIMDLLREYSAKAKESYLLQLNSPDIHWVTPTEMDVFVSEAGDDPVKLAWIERHLRLIEYMEEEPYVYQKGEPNPPFNRADRRRLRYRKAGKPVVSAKRT